MPIDLDYPDLDQILCQADYEGYYDIDPDERRANSANCGTAPCNDDEEE